MWFYALHNQQQGPVEEEQLKLLLQSRTIDSSSLVWREGMTQWTPLGQTELAKFLPTAVNMPTGAPIVPVAPPTPGYSPAYNPQLAKPAAVRIKELHDLFTTWWILLICGVVTLVIFIGAFALITAVVIQFMLLYKYWQVIQDGYARTTPDKAVGYSFIPFFNFYWVFVAIGGLSKDMNAYMARHQIQGEKLDEGLALAVPILTLVSIIPYVGIFTGIASLIIMIILFNKWKNAASTIIASQR
jgi:uncharacterized membrane protein YhaH (DUF805 family)